jgi:tetratricopeptide (TPR) repeat protein
MPLSPAAAYNVRLEDVESKTMQAGLRAATEGRLEEAERFFQIYLVQEDPLSASAYSNLGNVHQQQGRPALAVEDYTRAVELAPEVSSSEEGACLCAQPAMQAVNVGSGAESVLVLLQAPVPYLNRAISKEALGVEAAAAGDRTAALQLWRSAAADCDRAIELDEREFAAWFDRGNIQMRLEDYPAALTDFTTAADLAPGLAGGNRRGMRVYGPDCAQHTPCWLMMCQTWSSMQGMVAKCGSPLLALHPQHRLRANTLLLLAATACRLPPAPGHADVPAG